MVENLNGHVVLPLRRSPISPSCLFAIACLLLLSVCRVSTVRAQAVPENPVPDSYQSGVGVISGWACEADRIEIQLNDRPPQAAAYGTSRPDTQGVCGDSDNGFGLLFNWNRLSDGVHTVRALLDDAEFARTRVMLTRRMMGARGRVEFVVIGSCAAAPGTVLRPGVPPFGLPQPGLH